MKARLFRRMLDGSGALVCAKGTDGRYAYANARFIESLGLGRRFVPAATDHDLFPGAVARRLRERDAAALAAAAPSLSEEVIPVDGEDRVYLFDRFRLSTGDDTALLGIVAFPLDHGSAVEQDLLASRSLFEGILDIAADGVISVDEEQRIVLFNQGAERIFGYVADEVLGQPLDILLPPDARAMHLHHLGRFAKTGGSRQMGQRGAITGRRKDGSIFPAEASISRIEVGGRCTFTAILRDVSEARNAEDAIKALNDDLNHRAVQLESANRELEAFSYSVSHDLRAPLRSIDGFSQVLIEDFYDQLPEEARDSLQRIRAASQRMAQLIDDMLALSRFTRGTVNRTTVDLSAMAGEIAGEMQATRPERAVCFDITPGLAGDADPHLIRVVLVNLIGNAWKYTGKHDTARIEFGKFVDSHGRTVFFVRDDGAGFDMAYVNKLFGVFQRLHAMDEYAGTGVGLATVQRIIHKHGGEVWAEGAVERGATFYFTLA